METTHFPTIIIGSGSGGLTVANSLAQLGRKVALIESNAVGGDCTNVGCIPSKTLIHEASKRNGYDATSVLTTVRSKRDHLRDEETDQVKNTSHLTFIRGTARFLGPKRLSIMLTDGTSLELTGDTIVIATGSRPAMLNIDGLPSHRTLTNDTLFELPEAPNHLVIIGSGPIGLEMAFAFSDLGSRVTIATLDDRVLNKSPHAASKSLHDTLIARGIDLHYRTTAKSYNELSQTLMLQTPDGMVEVRNVEKVLIAIGRKRNIDNIGLEHTGVKFDPKIGIEIDKHGQTNVSGIFAIGDVTPNSYWTHSANAQGRSVTQRIAFPWLPAFGSEPLYPNATFSKPEVANVGLMPDQIAKKYHPKLVKTLHFDLPKTDKGYTEGLEHGFVHVSALRLTGQILGVTIVGPRASEMISFFTLAITERISLYKLFRLVYPYPTLSGAIQKIADQYVRETLPVVHNELYTVARYGLQTLWQRSRGREFEQADTSSPLTSDMTSVTSG